MPVTAVSAQLATVTVEAQDNLGAYAVIDIPGKDRTVMQFGALVQRHIIGDRLRAEGLAVTDLRETDGEDGELTMVWTMPRP